MVVTQSEDPLERLNLSMAMSKIFSSKACSIFRQSSRSDHRILHRIDDSRRNEEDEGFPEKAFRGRGPGVE